MGSLRAEVTAAMEVQDSRSLLILYGTETGNSQDIAEDLESMCKRLHFQTLLEEMNDVELKELLRNHCLVIFVISTTGQGRFPANSLSFWKSLRRAKLPPACLSSLNFTTFGLGDSSYSKFNWAARLLHSRLEKLGAKDAFPRGEADERHENGTDSIYEPWRKSLRAHLLAQFPLPAPVEPIPDDEPLPPKYMLRLKTREGAPAPDAKSDRRFLANREKSAVLSHVEKPMSPKEQFDDEWERQRGPSAHLARLDDANTGIALGERPIDILDKDNILKDHAHKYDLRAAPAAASSPPLPPAELLPIPDACEVTVLENARVTPADHWQDVRLIHLLLRLPEETRLRPDPGNAVVIYPKNFPEDVQQLIDAMGWSSIADEVVEFATHHSIGASADRLRLPVAPRKLYPKAGSTLRDLLIHNLDITAVPKRSFIEKIAHHAGGAEEKERLLELTEFDNSQEFYDYTSRPRRTILELLHDFPSVKIPFQYVADYFPVIRGREFSIANNGLTLLTREQNTICLEILAALVEYKTVMRKPRQGFCSRYLKHLPQDATIQISLKIGDPPPCGADWALRPLIAVATGTGIAPIRSLLHQRDDIPRPGPTMLFFGCRNEAKDFYFREEWPHLEGLKVIPAFSRDGTAQAGAGAGPYSSWPLTIGREHGGTGLAPSDLLSTGMVSHDYDRDKNYVQHLIRKHAKEVCEMYSRGAMVTVCGNSGRMPQSVRQALEDAAVLGGFCATEEEAKALFSDKNPNAIVYWQETW